MLRPRKKVEVGAALNAPSPSDPFPSCALLLPKENLLDLRNFGHATLETLTKDLIPTAFLLTREAFILSVKGFHYYSTRLATTALGLIWPASDMEVRHGSGTVGTPGAPASSLSLGLPRLPRRLSPENRRSVGKREGVRPLRSGPCLGSSHLCHHTRKCRPLRPAIRC